jgi:beta-galactosidase
LKTPAQATEKLPVPWKDLPKGGEVHANFRWELREATAYAPAGHLVAWSQVTLRPAPRPARIHFRRPTGEVKDTGDGVSLLLGRTRLHWSRQSGLLDGWERDRTRLDLRGPRLQITRAATDNDGLKLWSGQDAKPLGRWRNLGLFGNDWAMRLEEIMVFPANRKSAPRVVTVHAATGRGRWTDFLHRQEFLPVDENTILVRNEFHFGEEDITDLPRIGVVWILPGQLGELRYFGRGPGENYPDRRTAEILGIYENSVAGEYVDYVMPQEHGHHTDTRWVELAAGSGRRGKLPRLRWEGRPSFGFNATRYPVEALFAARHTIDLTPSEDTYLYLDAFHRGLGTASCGPDTLPEYRCTARHLEFDYLWSVLP